MYTISYVKGQKHSSHRAISFSIEFLGFRFFQPSKIKLQVPFIRMLSNLLLMKYSNIWRTSVENKVRQLHLLGTRTSIWSFVFSIWYDNKLLMSHFKCKSHVVRPVLCGHILKSHAHILDLPNEISDLNWGEAINCDLFYPNTCLIVKFAPKSKHEHWIISFRIQ